MGISFFPDPSGVEVVDSPGPVLGPYLGKSTKSSIFKKSTIFVDLKNRHFVDFYSIFLQKSSKIREFFRPSASWHGDLKVACSPRAGPFWRLVPCLRGHFGSKKGSKWGKNYFANFLQFLQANFFCKFL